MSNRGILYLFILFSWIAGLITWQGHISLLPVISTTFECFALWNQNTRHIRWLFLSARPTWVVYNLLVGSYVGLVTEAFIVSSIVVAIIRFDKPKKK